MGDLDVLVFLVNHEDVDRPPAVTFPQYPDEGLGKYSYPDNVLRLDLFVRPREGADEKIRLSCAVSVQGPSGKATKLKTGRCFDGVVANTAPDFALSPFVVKFRNNRDFEDGIWTVSYTVTDDSSLATAKIDVHYEFETEPAVYLEE